MGGGEPRAHGGDGGSRARLVHARREPGQHVVAPVTPRHGGVGTEGEGHPQLDAGRKHEVLRQDADDLVALAIDPYRAPDQRGLAAEAALPQPVAEQHHPGGARLVVRGQEVAAEQRRPPEGAQRGRGDARRAHPLGHVGARDVRFPVGDRRDVAEHTPLGLEVAQRPGRDAVHAVGRGSRRFPHMRQPARVAHLGQRPEGEGVGRAVHRGHRADTQRHAEHGERRDPRGAAQRANREAQVLQQRVHANGPPRAIRPASAQPPRATSPRRRPHPVPPRRSEACRPHRSGTRSSDRS